MSVRSTSSFKRTPRGRALTLVLLLLVAMAQPSLLFAGAWGSDQDCARPSEHCCCDSSPELPTPAPSESDCCGDERPEDQLPDAPSASSQCSCRAGSTPVPMPAPALPPGATDGTGERSLTEWVHAHARIFLHTPSWSQGAPLPAGVGEGSPVWDPRQGAARSSPASLASSVGAWTLLVRGVAGFLAVLSIARL